MAATVERLIAPYLARPLLGAEGVAAINGIARLFPAPVSAYFGFECRLGEPAAEADFLLSLSVANGRHHFLASPLLSGACPGLPVHYSWQRVRDFVRRWASGGDLLHQHADNLWLEFDVTGGGEPLPNFFFGTGAAELAPATRAELVRAGLDQLWNGALPAPIAATLERCTQALPAGARIFQVGMMLARPAQAIRICIRGIGVDEIAPYLRAVEWTGDMQGLAAELERLRPLVHRIDLDLDLADRVLPKIGLECYQAQGADEPACWQPLVSALRARGLCLPAKAEAVLSYCGASDMYTEGERWPAHLRAAAAFMRLRAVCVTFRAINHIKLSFDGRLHDAKAYLAVSHEWRQIQRLAGDAHAGV